MLSFLQQRATGRNIFLAAIVAIGCFFTFTRYLIPEMQAASNGYGPFDAMIPLSLEKITETLPFYNEQSNYYYVWFVIFDCIFPPAASLALTLLILYLADRNPHRFYDFLFSSKLIWIPLLGAAADLVENMFFMTVILSYPDNLPTATRIGLIAHQAKMILVPLANLLALSAILFNASCKLKLLLAKNKVQ